MNLSSITTGSYCVSLTAWPDVPMASIVWPPWPRSPPSCLPILAIVRCMRSTPCPVAGVRDPEAYAPIYIIIYIKVDCMAYIYTQKNLLSFYAGVLIAWGGLCDWLRGDLCII